MSRAISKITIEGYKSIRKLESFEWKSLNILIGPNGAGKSNLVSFFELLREVVEAQMQLYIAKKGGSDPQLFMGPKVTSRIVGKVYFDLNGYEFTLEPTSTYKFVFKQETLYFKGVHYPPSLYSLGSGHEEAKLKDAYHKGPYQNVAKFVYPAISSWIVYHFHDTSDSAAVKRKCSVRDNEKLRNDGSNLASYLLMLKEKYATSYEIIRNSVRLIAPFFDDFLLRKNSTSQGDEETELEWRQKGSDIPFHSSQLSDGTLRFICLATALLQPTPPSTIILDEPELGLHPYALAILASMLKAAATKTQVIVSTQSPKLVDYFLPEDIIVVDRENGESTFRRLAADSLGDWLKEYSLGELWQKNIIGGRPANA